MNQELSSTDGNRSVKAANSNELVIKKAREAMENVDFILNRIVQGEANEFGDWIHLAYVLMDDSTTE